MGRPVSGAFTLALGAGVAFALGFPWVAVLLGLSALAVTLALVADAIFSPARIVVREGFCGRLEKDTRIEAHAGDWVTIHPAREVPREDVHDILKRISRSPVYLNEPKMSAQEIEELRVRLMKKGED